MSDVAESNAPVDALKEASLGIAENPAPAAKSTPVKKVAPKKPEAAKAETKATPKKKAATKTAKASPKKKAAKTAKTAAPKKKVAKAAPKKEKAAKKAAGTGAGRPKKEGLRKPQVRILAVLAKANRGLTRAEISEKAKVDVAACVEYIGSLDEAKRLANDEKMGWKSLISLKYIKQAASEKEDARGAYYAITALGKAASEKESKAAKE